MKAWVLRGVNDIVFTDVKKPVPGKGQALIKVKAAGICGSDIPRIYDTGAHNMPLIPGHEFSGQVESVGSSEDEGFIGKGVGVFPLIPCRKCDQCLKGRYELCRNYDYLGSRSNGAFAEYVSVPVSSLIELPGDISFEAAAMLEPMAVTVHAIRRVIDLKDVDRDMRIAVYGLGTIGLFMVMFLKAEGFDNLIVIGNKEEQKNKVLKQGIDEESYFDGREEDVVNKIKAAGGADTVFECVGRSETYAASVSITRPAGSIVTVGNPFSDMTLPRDIYWKILRDQLTVRGTWNSSFRGSEDDDWHYVLDKLKSGKIDPAGFISHRYPLKDLDKGLAVMRDKSEYYGKVMAVMI